LITASIQPNGSVLLTSDQDYYCYNYTLKTAFQGVAQVAIGTPHCNPATNALESSQITDLYYSVNVLKQSVTNTLIPLTINANLTVSRWSSIQFSLLAEFRSEIEVNTFIAGS
jgi:hypothetical protein